MFGDSTTKEDLLRVSNALMTSADLVAAAVMRRMDPPKDSISRHQAELKYGRAWIRERIESGLLIGRRTGDAKNSKIVFSLLEIESLRTAENHISAGIKEKYKRSPSKAAMAVGAK